MSNGLVPGPANGLGSRTYIDDGTLPRIGRRRLDRRP